MSINNIKPPQNSINALSNAVKGASNSEQRFTKAADNLIKSYNAAANITSSTAGEKISPETLAAASDPVSPMVDMKTSQRAYEANLKVISTVNEMEQQLLDILA